MADRAFVTRNRTSTGNSSGVPGAVSRIDGNRYEVGLGAGTVGRLTPYQGTGFRLPLANGARDRMRDPQKRDRTGRGAGGLWAAAITGLLASLCCVVPLLLVAAGIGGAWLSDLTALDPLRPILTGLTVALLVGGHLRYWQSRRLAACGCGGRPPLWLWGVTLLVVMTLAAPYVVPALIVPSIPPTP